MQLKLLINRVLIYRMILTTTNAQGQDTTNSTIYVFIIMMYGFFKIFFILKYINFF
jgi:hypothetical protein